MIQIETEIDYSVMRVFPKYKPKNRESRRPIVHEFEKINQKIIDLEVLFCYEVIHGEGEYKGLYQSYKKRFENIIESTKHHSTMINKHYWEQHYSPM
jgi:hypothetical protein